MLSAIGIAGMDRLVRFNVLAMSGRAVEAAGDVDTLAARQDRHHHPGQSPGDGILAVARRRASSELAEAAQLASLADETPEGRSIVVLAKEKYGIRGREMAPLHANFIPFSAQTRISGIDVDGIFDPQGRGGCGAGLDAGGQCRRRNADRHLPTASPRPAARRWRWRRMASCWASSI